MAERLGDANVFMDVELKPGIDFVDRITEVVGACSVVLVVIGPAWASPARGATKPRVADPDDFVGLEVRTALLRSDVSVLPLLVAGARMPDPDGLPEDLRALTRLNALELSDLRWRYDVGRLLTALDEALAPPGASPSPTGTDASPRVRRWLFVAALPVAKPGETRPPVQVDIGVSGEHANLTFKGTEGERIAPDVRNVTAPAKISIVDPADEAILGAGFEKDALLRTEKCTTPAGCQPVTLKRSGTHELVISGDSDHTGSLDLRLYAVAPDVRKKTEPGARPAGIELGVGQAAMVTFPWRGDPAQLALRLLDLDVNGYVNVRAPSGGLVLKDTAFFGSDGERNLSVPVSQNGTYSIHIRTNDISSGSLRLQLD